MNRYEVKMIVDRDADGLIDRIGVEWGETTPALDKLLGAVATMGILFGSGIVLIGLLASNFVAVCIGALLLCLVRFLWVSPRRARAIYLHASGSLEAPFGTSFNAKPRSISKDHTRIVSIEARPDRERHYGRVHENLFEVVILFRSGDLVVLTQNLFEEVALKVAAQLTQSRQELERDSVERAMRMRETSQQRAAQHEYDIDELLEIIAHQTVYGSQGKPQQENAPNVGLGR